MHEIQDAQKEARKEQKYLDDSYLDRSPTPNSFLKPERTYSPSPSLSPSPSPSPEIFVAADGERYRTGTLELLTTAPTHLKKKNDDKVLEEFFGSEQISKLNELKVSLAAEEISEEEETPTVEMMLEQSSESSDVPIRKKLKIPLNPNQAVTDRNRMSYNVASEMEQLRMRIQERARLELEELDKKYSPKMSHPGFGLIDSGNHSRQGSLDSSIPLTASTFAPPPVGTGHTRQFSLPVFPDPSTLTKNSPSPQPLDTQDKVRTLERDESTSRSPTPPLQYLHVHQVSNGSGSSLGSGTFSPPLLQVTSPSNQAGHLPSHKPFNTPPVVRSPRHHNPQFHSFKEPSHTARPQSGRLPQMYNRDTAISHTHSSSVGGFPSHPQSSNQQYSTSTEPRPRSNSSNNTHYSTSVLKRNKRNSPETNKTSPSPPHNQGYSNGYPASKPPLPASYNIQSHRRSNGDLDQPEIKSIPRTAHLRKAPSGEKVAASPRMGRGSMMPSGLVPDPNATHQKLGLRASDTTYLGTNLPNFQSSQVHPEDIEPYMTSRDAKSQMFKYTPFTDTAKEKSRSLEAPKSSQNKPTILHPNDQTWC